MALSDHEIKELCKGDKPLISPYVETLVSRENRAITSYETINGISGEMPNQWGGWKSKEVTKNIKIISYGPSSYGYDLRAGFKYKVFTNVNGATIDPKDISDDSFVDKEAAIGEHIIIPPNGFILTYSLEHLSMPRNVTGIVIGKSTYARAGVVCICTPLEAGWAGYVTLEFANTTPAPVKFYPGEGCCQVVFLTGNECDVSYDERNGKYMNQAAQVVLPKV